jgi:tetratricopeptide (TPR) repeat protein
LFSLVSCQRQIYQEKKDYAKALSLYEESLVVGRAALGSSHMEIAMLLNRLGNFHFDRGDFDQALTAYEEGLQIERRVLDEAHPNTVVTLTNIGEVRTTELPSSDKNNSHDSVSHFLCWNLILSIMI